MSFLRNKRLYPLIIRAREFWHVYKFNKFGIIGLIILSVFLFIAIFADFLAPYPEWELGVGAPFEPPSFKHIFGTDELGRDLFSLFIYGTRISLIVGTVAAFLSTMIGGMIGIFSGYIGKKIDTILMRIADALLSIPALVLMIILAALLGPSITNIIIVISVLSWPSISRVIRSQVLTIKESLYIEATKSIGASSLRIIFLHILPNVTPLLFANMILSISGAILSEAALSFLGLGDPHHTSWGMILHYAQGSGALAAGYWWYVIPPGIGILLLVLGFIFVGYALDEIINPKLRKH